MSRKSPAYYVIIYILLMLMQISIFGNMAILGYATPFLFLYFILKLPSALSPNWVMTLSFITCNEKRRIMYINAMVKIIAMITYLRFSRV